MITEYANEILKDNKLKLETVIDYEAYYSVEIDSYNYILIAKKPLLSVR